MDPMMSISSRSLQYYVIARRWFSDLEFFRLETSFLHQLLDQYINRLQDQDHLQKLISTNRNLEQLEKMVSDNLLTGQINQLELMAEDIIPEDAESLAANQVKLEYFMTDLTNKFRTVKQEIFRLVLEIKHEDNLITN